ncbi:glycosyltransferase family 4 protein [Bacteroidota bacterium]
MVIAVNVRLLIKDKLEGIGWFTYESLKRITVNHPEHSFIFIFDRPYDKELIFSDNITPVVAGPPTRHPFLWFFWLEFIIPGILKKYNADLFLSPDGYLSLSTNVPSLGVIHDINFAHRPKDLPFFTRKYYNYFFPKFAKKAQRLATVSEYSKKDISESYNIIPENIDVVYNGCSTQYKPLDKKTISTTREKYSDGKEYFTFIGALNPRKNVSGLLKAFDEFKSRTSSSLKMIIVGENKFGLVEINNTLSSLMFKEDIIFTGRLSQDELTIVLGSAFALTFVPFFEGFGIPVLEALYCDVPVISSDQTSLPEVAGEAAIYVDPFSTDSIVNAMIKLYENPELRKELITKGRIQREKFSWDKTADKLWSSIESIKS